MRQKWPHHGVICRGNRRFSRLGYDIKDASALAQAALIYTNVGDSIESISDATTSIISTMKAFNIEAQSSMDIVDMFNEVGRLLPIPVVTRCLAECYIGQSSVGKCAWIAHTLRDRGKTGITGIPRDCHGLYSDV